MCAPIPRACSKTRSQVGIRQQTLERIRQWREICPDLAIHASTQMTLTSAECIQVAQELGIERVVLPRELSTATLLRWLGGPLPPNVFFQTGGLAEALREASLAIASTGTVTMECAFMRLPTVTLYKGSWLNYQIARWFITVKSFTMANILAGEEVYPEFLQYNLTAENLAHATLEILDAPRQAKMRTQLDKIIASLGEPGATRRAADAILKLL